MIKRAAGDEGSGDGGRVANTASSGSELSRPSSTNQNSKPRNKSLTIRPATVCRRTELMIEKRAAWPRARVPHQSRSAPTRSARRPGCRPRAAGEPASGLRTGSWTLELGALTRRRVGTVGTGERLHAADHRSCSGGVHRGAGFDVGGSVSAETFSRPEPILGHLSRPVVTGSGSPRGTGAIDAPIAQ